MERQEWKDTALLNDCSTIGAGTKKLQCYRTSVNVLKGG